MSNNITGNKSNKSNNNSNKNSNNEIKEFLKSIWRNRGTICGVILSLTVIVGVCIYGLSFVRNGDLLFTREDIVILSIIGFTLFMLASLFIWIILDRRKVYNLLYEIINLISDGQADNSILHRDNEHLILNILDKVKGVAK